MHGHISFHLDNPDPVERETISNPIQIQEIQISDRVGPQNPDPVHHWCPTLGGAKTFPVLLTFFSLCLVCTQCPHIFTTQKQY